MESREGELEDVRRQELISKNDRQVVCRINDEHFCFAKTCASGAEMTLRAAEMAMHSSEEL